jgi:hypothetical protein
LKLLLLDGGVRSKSFAPKNKEKTISLAIEKLKSLNIFHWNDNREH